MFIFLKNKIFVHSTPVFVDLNNDGANDLVVGSNAGKIYIFTNIGNSTLPVFNNNDVDITASTLTSEDSEFAAYTPSEEPQALPNPTTGQLRINLNRLAEQDVTLTVLNVQGAMIETQKVYAGTVSLDFDLRNQPSGMYLVTMMTASGERVTQKVIKE